MNAVQRVGITVASVVLTLGVAITALPGSAGAAPSSPPLFGQCPAVGRDTGCQELITISQSGVATVATDPSQPFYDAADDTLVGIVNKSNALASSVGLSGSHIFGFDGDGLCTEPGACTSPTQYGPTGYEGPGTSFAVASGQTTSGTVNLTGGLAPGASTYFSLELAPFTVTSVALLPDITLTGPSLTGVEGQAVTGTVATFTDGPSAAPPSAFSATVTWGDGSTSLGTISQTSPGSPYVVAAPHTYSEEGTFHPSVTVTDNALALNTATASGSAAVADAPVTATSSTIANQVTNTAFTVPVATFTDGNPAAPTSDFTVAITWGDGGSSTGTVTQTGGIGTTFTAAGSHTYTSHGTFTVGVTVTDSGGSSSSVTDSVTVVDSQVTCSTSGCSGSVTTSSQSVQIASTSTTGTIDTTVDPFTGSFSCGDSFRHAPQVTTVTDTGLGANIVFTMTFANKNASGLWWVPFAVCYQSVTPFTSLTGHQVTTGLLPVCRLPFSTHTASAPCVQSISELPFLIGNVVEKVVVPAGDPRIH